MKKCALNKPDDQKRIFPRKLYKPSDEAGATLRRLSNFVVWVSNVYGLFVPVQSAARWQLK